MDKDIIGLLSPGEGAAGSGWYRWGMEFVRAIQGPEHPALTALASAISLLGSELFYVPVILFIYWCVDERKGQRLALLLLVSAWLNTTLKSLVKQPRPYFLDPSVGRARSSGYGLPSGHAQQSLVFWAAALSGPLGKRRVWIISAAVTGVIGFTRIYLGVHFPTDLAAGWLLALGLLGLYGLLAEPAAAFLRTRGTRVRMLALAGAAFGMNALHSSDRSLPALFLGFGAGYALMIRSFPFSAADPGPGRAVPPFLHRPLRFVLGAAGLFLIYRGLGGLGELLAAPAFFLGASEPGRFLHYGLLGFWASAGAPWLFLRLRLGGPGQRGAEPQTIPAGSSG